MPERAGFDEFVEARAAALHRSAYLLTGSWQSGEDLVQSALAVTWSHWRTVRDPGAAEAYTRRVMVRLASAGWRRKWRGEIPTAELPDSAGVIDDYANADRRSMLQAALRRLPARQRAVVVLRFYDDMTEAQAAEAMRCPVGTVKSLTSRALARLRELGVSAADDEETEAVVGR
jgi:RNA polymerase sigma-70 factor (sigma-E family)